MKIGFIGAGNVGGTLARKLGQKGHSIFLGTRDVEKPEIKQLQTAIGGHATAGSLKECIAGSDVIFLATPWSGVDPIIKEYKVDLANKVLVDCTNPLKPDLSGLIFSGETSGGEYIQHQLPKTKVVKAFNTVGYNIMEDPVMEGRKAVMYFSGDDQDARHQVKELITDVGFAPMDAGELKACRLIESFALLWISSAYKFGLGRNFAFTILKKQ